MSGGVSTDPSGAPLFQVAADIAAGKLSAEDYAAIVANALHEHSALNATTVWDEGQFRAAAGQLDETFRQGGPVGVLHGVPLILKDNINTQALPTSAGTPALVGNIPKADAPIAARLFSAGALLAAKGNLHELSSGGTSANHVFGPARNPYDPQLIPGGSSGGVAAAVAARLVPAGIGTDTAGSVRVPASLCGVLGFRPTTGRYPAGGIAPLSTAFDTAGPIARCMQDIIVLDAVMAGQRPNYDKPPLTSIRLGVAEDLIAASTEAVVGPIRSALGLLEAAGVTLVPVEMEPFRELNAAAAQGVIETEFLNDMAAYLADHAPAVGLQALAEAIASPGVRALTLKRLEDPPPADIYLAARREGQPRLEAAWQALLEDHDIDAVALPTTPDVALPWAEDDNVIRDGEAVFSWFYFSHTAFASFGCRPGITLPIGLSPSGLPVGLELDGLPSRDEELLGIALSLESVLPQITAPK
jgi:Asp-tRNA(Asn)/Glu-tRNA(Gln) amidotransferase A subunit family amidase